MARPTDEPGELVAACRGLEERLGDLRDMLATPGDELTEEREDRPRNDAAVVAVVGELRPLAKRSRKWLKWAAGQVHRAERDADQADDASLQAAVAEVEAIRGRARELVDEAVAALDVAQRAALGRHLVTTLGHADKYWGPRAEQERSRLASHQASRPGTEVRFTELDEFVEYQLADFRAKAARLRFAGVDDGALAEWQQRPIPPTLAPLLRPMKRRWRSMLQPLQAIEARGREIDEACQRLRQAHERAVAQRRRAEHDAARERRQAEQEAEARRRTEEADRLTARAADLLERFEAFRREWALSGRLLRERGWTGLLKQLTEGVRDDGVVVVAGVPRNLARAVLAVLRVAGEHGDDAGARLGELLAGEDRLLDERARLHEAVAGLPVDAETVTRLADLHAELRPAYEWLCHHGDEVVPALGAQAPEEARALGAALRNLRHADP